MCSEVKIYTWFITTILYKGGNSEDFLIAFLNIKPRLERDLFQQEKEFAPKSRPNFGMEENNVDRVSSLESLLKVVHKIHATSFSQPTAYITYFKMFTPCLYRTTRLSVLHYKVIVYGCIKYLNF